MTSLKLTNDQIIDLISDYKTFKRIIEVSLPEDRRRRDLNSRNNDKNLSKLSNVQFWELATDVNNELMKRLTNSNMDVSQNDLDLKRGKAQSKLSRLNDIKFHKLIFDIFTEIEKRNLHHLDMMTHANTLDKGELNFYLNDSLFESVNINDDFMSVDGIISIETFRELRTHFAVYFQNTLQRTHPVDATAKRLPVLLETVIKIAKLIGDLLPLLSSVSLHDSLENEIVYLKSALSHAITSTRYFLAYEDLIPRIVTQSSISEVIFAFCNIVQIVKIKPTSSSHGALSNERELSDIEPDMKPLKIIEKVKNEKNGKNEASMGNNTGAPVSSSSSDKVIMEELDMSVIEASPLHSIIEKSDSSVGKSTLARNNASEERDPGFVSLVKNTTDTSRATTEPSSRDNLAPKVPSKLSSSSSQGRPLPLIGKFQQDYQSSPPKKATNKLAVGTAKPYTNIPPTVDVLRSPNMAKMRRFREKVQKFGPNSGLGLRISTSEEDMRNSDVKPITHNVSINNLIEFVESKATIVLPLVQKILNDIQASKSKAFNTSGSIPSLCQDSIKIIPILESLVDMTTKVIVQKDFKRDLTRHSEEVVERLTDCSQRLSELCTNGCNSTDFGSKRFYQKLAEVLLDVTKRTKKLVKCMEMANEQTLS